ncbi:putative toxin [Paenibacillus chitinolyticus]|uniref:putative toxin n=1 Tax=Paenibacillus chitinolyticus TaxID=79263 RepID=UPI003899635B
MEYLNREDLKENDLNGIKLCNLSLNGFKRSGFLFVEQRRRECDAIVNGRIVEVKNQAYIYKSGQFRDYLDSGMPIDLIISPRANISKPLKDAIYEKGESIKIRYIAEKRY